MAVSAYVSDLDGICPACGAAVEWAPGSCRACDVELALEVADVQQWRGYRDVCFILCDGDGSLVAESPSFRSRRLETEGPAALAALEALLAGLGWHPTGADLGPFERRYERLAVAEEATVAALPAPAAVPEPAPAPAPAPAPVAAPRPAPPPPVRVEAPVAATADEPRPSSGRRLPFLANLVAWVGLALAIVLLVVLITERGGTVRTETVVQVRNEAVTTAAPAPAKARAAGPAAPARLHVVVTANRTSWLEIRRTSATGPVVFAGSLEDGRTIRVAGRRLWGRFGAAGNVSITVNGKPLALVGTTEHTFRPASR